MKIEQIIAKLEDECKSGALSGDVLTTAKDVACKVTAFMSEENIGVSREDTGIFRLSESFDDTSVESIGTEKIIDLVKAANVPVQFQAQAATSVATALYSAALAGAEFSSVAAAHTVRAEQNGVNGIVSAESLLPASTAAQFQEVSMESFGATSDKVVSDLKAAIVVSLMKWHTSLTPRALQTITATQPVVNYIREELKVYNLEGVVEDDVSVVDLYANPAMVSNELTRINPLAANDVAGECPADGTLAFNKEALLLALGIDATVYGHDKVNRTDIVADGIKLESVTISIDDGTNPAEAFTIAIPESVGRLTRDSNQVSTLRTANIRHVAILNDAVDTDAAADSVVLGEKVGPTAGTILTVNGEKLVVTLNITPRVDIRDGATFTMGSVSVVAKSADNGAAAGATDTALGSSTITLSSYTLDARYAEENNRKSNIACTTERTQFSYEIPQGRNYVLDVPHTGPQIDRTRNIANLHNLIRIGQDNVTLDLILSVLAEVGIAQDAYAADPVASNRPGSSYAAGGRVRPYYIGTTLDLSSIDSFDDGHRQDAIEGKALTFLTSITAELLTNSFYEQQLENGQPVVFRVITSGKLLANVLGARVGTHQIEAGPGVELALKLSNGIILECVTTTFDAVSDKIVIVPWVGSDSSSDLNFGQNNDFGAIVGQYSHSSGTASVQRLLANVRELPVPTNAMGAIIEVTGIDSTTTYRA